MYLRALEEIGKSNPEVSGLFLYIRENLEKLFHSLLYKKKVDIINNKIGAKRVCERTDRASK